MTKKQNGYKYIGKANNVTGNEIDSLKSLGYEIFIRAEDKTVHARRIRTVYSKNYEGYKLAKLVSKDVGYNRINRVEKSSIWNRIPAYILCMSIFAGVWIVSLFFGITIYAVDLDSNNVNIIDTDSKKIEVKERAISYYKTGDKNVQGKIFDKFSVISIKVAKEALAIAKCESNFNPTAINTANKNGSWDYGLFQINSIHKHNPKDLLNADYNIDVAFNMYKSQKWTPWVCKKIVGIN
jgi:hypothetical protein